MCYPKPGPRCSAHAAAQLTRVKHQRKILLEKQRNNQPVDGREFEIVSEALTNAEREYDSTPAGMKELERRIERYDGKQREQYQFRLEMGKQLRALQLEALRSEDKGDMAHDFGPTTTWSMPEKHRPQNKLRTPLPTSSKEISTLINDSERWHSTLTPDEMEAVAWVTSDGSSVINGYLAGRGPGDPGYYRHHTQTDEKIKDAIAKLDSAFTKWDRPGAILVYRGINAEIPDDFDYDDQGHNWATKHFPVGSTYQSPTYMSTSLDPNSADNFASSGVIFEILTARAAPVVNVSAWDVTERELLTPRNQKYKVVKVLKNVPFGDKKKKRTVVQLVEEEWLERQEKLQDQLTSQYI